MPASTGSRKDPLKRRGWLLWAVTFIVMFALTAAVPLLYLPLLSLMRSPDGGLPPGFGREYTAVAGLTGLVLVFCLYTALEQRELNRTRERLAHEEREKEDVRARLSELSMLFQVSTSLNLQLKLEDILEIIVRRVVWTLKAQQASVMILDPAAGVLETRASYGLESEFAKHARQRLGEGIAGWVAERNEAVQLDSNSGVMALRAHYKINRNISSALSLPLRVGERCVGVLNVNRINHPTVFEEHHREILQIFAEHVGSVIDRAEAMERLGSRARELEADNLKLHELNHLKDVFLSTASHELKTPLTSVIAYAELLGENESRLNREQRGEFLRRLRNEAGRLLSLIDDILDLTRIESGKLTLKRVAVSAAEIVHAAIETTRSLAQKRAVELREVHDAALAPVYVDEVKMRQVVVNLLVNAVKFSPEAGAVTVATRADGDCLRIEVSDDGPGIAPDEATHIFELFGQGQGDPELRSGLGIGLHLVKRITELHGGHVGVNSRQGEGSTFWVRLPLPAAQPAEEPEQVRRAA